MIVVTKVKRKVPIETQLLQGRDKNSEMLPSRKLFICKHGLERGSQKFQYLVVSEQIIYMIWIEMEALP